MPILIVRTGHKVGLLGQKDCVGSKGTCFLWFGGLFLSESNDFSFQLPHNLLGDPAAEDLQTNSLIGVHVGKLSNDSIDLLYDYSCANHTIAQIWEEDAATAVHCIGDTIVFVEPSVLEYLKEEDAIFLPSGVYPIKIFDPATCQFVVRVPYYIMEQ